MLISICIPSYNRPEEIDVLLRSIDCDPSKIEVVICEDHAPQREKVREVVNKFISGSHYKVNYIENPVNLGYDGNIRKIIQEATADFILFMGDDDRFYAGALDQFFAFMQNNLDVGYVLRSYYGEHPDGRLEMFKYFKESRRLEPSLENCSFLFKRTVSIAGVTFNRQAAVEIATTAFDGTLLYQLYLVLEIAYKRVSVFCDIPVAIVAQTFRKDIAQFGAASSESKFEPGKVTASNSIAFTQGFFEITRAFDMKHGTNITKLVQLDLSKYSYPFLSIQRKRGINPFLRYAKRLEKEVGFGRTPHFYIYKWGLVLLGERLCDRLIVSIKNVIGHTPNF
jgi:abequosyltransferase